MIKIKSAAKVREEEEAIFRAQQACVERPRTSDMTDYNTAMSNFREAALCIRQYINTQYPDLCERNPCLKTYRASYEETPLLFEVQLNDKQLDNMIRIMQYWDQVMEYEARALCIREPNSWIAAWRDELGGDYATLTTPAS